METSATLRHHRLLRSDIIFLRETECEASKGGLHLVFGSLNLLFGTAAFDVYSASARLRVLKNLLPFERAKLKIFTISFCSLLTYS